MKAKNDLLRLLCLVLMIGVVCQVMGLTGLNAAQAATIKLNQTKATAYLGGTLKLKVTGTKSTVKWSSSDAKIAKVSSKGVVTPKKAGKATITAKVGKKTLKCAVTVKQPLWVSENDITLKKGKSKKIWLTWKLTGSFKYTYDNASVIKVTLGKKSTGDKWPLTIKALKAGTTTITITNSKTNHKVKVKVTVKGSGATEPIVDQDEITVSTGKTATVQVTWPYDEMPYYETDGMVDCTWGSWNDSGWPLKITGLIEGTTEVVLRKGQGGETVATIRVTVQ